MSGPKIPTRGPAEVTLPNGYRLRLWYSPEWRSWGVNLLDADGDPVWHESRWSAHRAEAVDDLREAWEAWQ